MHHFFTSNIGTQHIHVLHGLGGAGKTQIALKFINESSSCFSDIFFIDASTVATMDTGLKNIAVVKDSGDSQQDGLLWLTSKVEEWLLVFDNADDPGINLNDFIPQCNHGNIIITSRNPGLRVHAQSHSLVWGMEEKDAATLLLKRAAQATTIDTKQIAKIVKALHYLPLAIIQAGAFISKSQDFDGYLTLYTKNKAQLLSEKPNQSHDHYAWTVYTTWQMNFNQLKPLAAMFLQLCSFLYHEGISEEIFSHASKYRVSSSGPSKEELQESLKFLSYFLRPTGEWDPLQFSYVTNEVQAYSLMSFDAEKKLFSIHPLVHDWSRTTVSDPERYMSIMGSILGMAISERPKQNIQLASLVLCPHVDSAVKMDAKVALHFERQYSLIFWEAGKYKQAEKLLKGVLGKQKQLLGENHPHTLQTRLKVLEEQKQILGDNHPDTLHTMGDLASTYSDLGQHKKAKELRVIVLEKRKQLLGDNHPDTLHTMGNLAKTYSDLREHKRAKELQGTVLEKQKWLLGDNHPDTLCTKGKPANTYSDLGEHRKAKELQVIVLEKQKQLLWLSDFNGHQISIPWQHCQSWQVSILPKIALLVAYIPQDLCIFLGEVLKGVQESRFIGTRSFGIHIPNRRDLLSHESWDSWVSAIDGDLWENPPTLELYAIMKDDSDSCPHCNITHPATKPLPDFNHQQW
ncbi:P-loop containing nucleoside triphosphate hydrolase protein [Mycena galericulata]|nr:P-loop containing nucleoside triphosphate hydrolase protein [Mycena galericulata]